MTSNGNTSGWQKAALSGAFAILLAAAGWGITDSQTARQETRQEITALKEKAALDQQRIATVEEGMRQMQRSLDRIEAALDDLRRRR